jgi:hypothetical protein
MDTELTLSDLKDVLLMAARSDQYRIGYQWAVASVQGLRRECERLQSIEIIRNTAKREELGR